ncbi:MAG: hypothetical protein KatS3mg076_1515 [Candidatus Binatia bacterium]|nr:MAG: hypothetical protein KatS3mg076_1515 [Candidatus Binatia bacterium]
MKRIRAPGSGAWWRARSSGIALVWALLIALPEASVAGPVDSPIPPNPCGTKPLKLAFVADGIGTDAGGTACAGAGSVCVETMVVCKHAGKTGSTPMDIAVELFDASGTPLVPLACASAVPPGGGASFVTSGATLPSPYVGTTPITAGPVSPLGSLRVLSTIPGKTACDVTVIDTRGPASGTTTAAPLWTSGPTITKKKAPQKGD